MRDFRLKLMQIMIASFFSFCFVFEAVAQIDPRQILSAVIQQLQTGTPNPSWYGIQLWQTIAAQTNNSGVYPPLAHLGPVTNITIYQQIQMPAGPVYSMLAQHQNGTSTWTLGISIYSNRIEYASFNIGTMPPSLPPSPTGQPVPRTAPTPGTPATPPTPSPPSSPGSTACQRFPNLC